MSVNGVVSHVKENKNKRIDRNYGNIITLSLWGVVLASHIILIPKLVRELADEFKKQGK